MLLYLLEVLRDLVLHVAVGVGCGVAVAIRGSAWQWRDGAGAAHVAEQVVGKRLLLVAHGQLDLFLDDGLDRGDDGVLQDGVRVPVTVTKHGSESIVRCFEQL